MTLRTITKREMTWVEGEADLSSFESVSDEQLQAIVTRFVDDGVVYFERGVRIVEMAEVGGTATPEAREQCRRTLKEGMDAFEEAKTWSWKGAAVGGALGGVGGGVGGAFAGAAIGVQIGCVGGPVPAVIGGVVGLIAGLIAGGLIGGLFAQEFSNLLKRIRAVQVSFRGLRAGVMLGN